MAEEIVWEPLIGGYSASVRCGAMGLLKLAVLGTTHDQGLSRNGVTLREALPRDQWGLHFTSPGMSVESLRAILDSLPAEALPPVVQAMQKAAAE